MIWTNGEIIPPEALRIDVRDETFQHGLGLFETLRTWKGHADITAPQPGADATFRP